MGLFTRSTRQESGGAVAAAVAPMDAGRRLSSASSPQDCARLLVRVFSGYREQKYPELPLLVPAGVRWLAAEGTPIQLSTLRLTGLDL